MSSLIKDSQDSGPEKQRAFVKDVVEELEALQDISRQPRGLWVPSPLRIVSLENTEESLLIGTCPNQLLSNTLRANVKFRNVVRMIPSGVGEGLTDLPRQTWREWSQVSEDDLRTWTEGLINNASFAAVEGDWVGEVYTPEAARARGTQYDRWTPIRLYSGNGIRLVRLRANRGWVEYGWGAFQDRRLMQLAELDLAAVDRRRLMYGLDLLAGMPTTAQMRRDGNEIVVTLRSTLPVKQERVLQAIGQLILPLEARFYPRIWRVPLTFGELVQSILQQLGITVLSG